MFLSLKHTQKKKYESTINNCSQTHFSFFAYCFLGVLFVCYFFFFIIIWIFICAQFYRTLFLSIWRMLLFGIIIYCYTVQVYSFIYAMCVFVCVCAAAAFVSTTKLRFRQAKRRRYALNARIRWTIVSFHKNMTNNE